MRHNLAVGQKPKAAKAAELLRVATKLDQQKRITAAGFEALENELAGIRSEIAAVRAELAETRRELETLKAEFEVSTWDKVKRWIKENASRF